MKVFTRTTEELFQQSLSMSSGKKHDKGLMKFRSFVRYCLPVVLLIMLFNGLDVSGQTNTRFNDGYLTVFKVTSGAALTSAGTAIVTEEYIPTGSLQTGPNFNVALPVIVGSPNKRVVAAGNSGTMGAMTRSENGRYLTIPGYDNAVGDANTAFSTAAMRTVDGAGNIFAGIQGTFHNTGGSNFRSAITDDGTNFWTAGSGTGILYSSTGTATTVSTGSTNSRVINIFNGQLYFSTGAGSQGIYSVGSGKPTTTGQTSTRLFIPTSAGDNGFSVSPDGKTIYYVSDLTTQGLYRSTFDGVNWTTGTLIFAGNAYTGVAVDWLGYTFNTAGANGAVIYACNPTTLIKALDNGTSTVATPVTLRTSSGNNAFRGLAFSPVKQTVSRGANSPAAGFINIGSNVVLFQFNLAANEGNSTIKKLILANTGSATIGTGNNIDNFRLIEDANSDGIADPSEILAALSTGTVAGGNITFSSINMLSYITEALSKNFLVIGDVASGATNTFIPSIVSNKALNAVNYTTNLINAGGSWVNIGATAPTGNTLTIAASGSISFTGSLSAVSTTYGTASAVPATVSVSGSGLTGDILVTPPAGYEVSQTSGGGSGYANTQTLTQTGGNVGPIDIYLRLKAIATVAGNPYSGNVVLSSLGVSPSVDVPTTSSTVSPLAINTTGAIGVNKVYDRTFAAAISGATTSEAVNGDVITITGGGTFADFLVANNKPITAALSASGTNASSYTIIQPTGLQANITQAPLTINTAQAQDKVFDGNTDAVITGTLNGIISPDVVTFNGTGTFATSAVGNNIPVTSTSTLSGADQANYSLTQPTGLTANITGGGSTPQTISFTLSPAATYGDAPITLNGTATSSLTVSYLSSNTAVATVSGNTLTIVGVGSTNITASQAGDGTYAAATDVVQPLTVGQKTLTVTGAVAQPKPYDGNANAVITGATLVGIVGSDNVTVSGGGTFADINVGTAIAVTANLVLGGTESARYLLTQPTGLSADITPASQTIIFGPLTPKTFGDASFTLTATGGGSGNPVTFGSSLPSVASVSGNTVTINGGGSTTITASQAAGGNYAAATDVLQTLLVNPAAQTITFNALPNKTTADAPFALTATAGSGQLVTYVSSNPLVASISGSTVTLVGVGTTTITASQGGNANYLPAPNVDQTLTVTNPVIAAWQFGSPASLGDEATYNATTNHTDLNTVVLSRGAVILPTPLGRGFSANNYTFGAGNTKANAISTNQSLTFAINPKPGFLSKLTTLDARLRRSSQGPNAYIWAYSTDGVNFNEIGTDVSFTSTVDGVDQAQLDLSAIPALQSIGSATTVTFRLYAWGATAATGTFAIGRYGASITTNSLYITGTVIPLPAPVITSSLTASATVGAAFNYTITASNNPTGFGSTDLPLNNLSINTSTGLISGTPSLAGPMNINISATNGTGTDNKTLAITVGKGSQAISAFPTTDTRTYGDGPYGLSATGGGSGNPVTYVSSNTGVATISGNTVTIVGAGTTNITASQAGDANWFAAPDVVQVLTVNKANQAITFAPLPDKSDIDPPFTLTATATSGLPVSFASSNSLVATVSGTTVTITGYGNTTITASQAGDANYNAAPDVLRNQHVTNSNAQGQTITFNPLPTKVYGDAPFQLTATASSSLTVTYASSNPLVATVLGDMVTITGPGTTNITASQAGDLDYNPAPDVIQALNVDPKTLTVTGAVAQNKVYDGSANAVITGATLVGIVGSDNVTVSGGGTFADPNVATGIAVAANLSLGDTDAGKYLLTQPTGLSADITQASQTITFNALTAKTYGDAPFTLSGTASSNLTVSYSSLDPSVATISGNLVTIVGAGSTTITATQLGDQNYAAAPQVQQILVVNKASQTITFAALPNKRTSDLPFNLAGTSTSGLTVTYASSNPAVATVTGNTVTITGVGTTNITASQLGDLNYLPAPDVIRTLTVGYPLIAAWDFTGPGNVATTAAAIFNSNLNSSNLITRGAGAASSSGLNSFRTVGFQNNGISVANTDYFQTTLGAGPGRTVSLSSIEAIFNGTASFFASPGVTSQFAYSLDGTNFTLINSPVTSTSLTMTPIDLTGISALQNVSNGTTITIRYYASGQTPTGGWGFFSSAAGVYGLAFGGSTTLPPAPVITSSLTDNGTVNVPYSYTITATNTPPSYNPSYNATGLPAGLGVNTSTGAITGTPTAAGTFNVSISATNDGGTDTKTLVLTIAKADQTITGLPALDTRTYGDAPYNLSAIASSGLTVSYASSNPAVATISGNQVTITGGGTTTITASQAGDLNYNPAPDVTQTLTVNKLNQTITFGSLPNKLDTDPPFALTATATSGLGVTYQSSNLSVATVSGNIVTIVAPGSTDITASQAGDDNYNAAPDVIQVQLVYSATAANQTITFGALPNKVYGDIPFGLTATASSSLPVSYSSSNPAVATVSGSTVTIVGPGTTNITASQPGDFVNYNAAPDVTQPLTVDPKTLTVSGAVAQNKVYDGNANAVITGATLVGIVGSDNVTVSGGGTFADPNVATGISVAANLSLGGTDAGKYLLTQPTGLSADITIAGQTITFGPLAPKVTTDPPFALTATASSSLPVSYTSSNPLVATVSGSTVTITGDGSTIITATQGGNSNYTAAPAVQQTLVVNASTSIVMWDFGAALPGTAAPSTGVPAGLTVSNMSQNNNNGTTAMLSTGNTSLGSYPGASGGVNAAASSISGPLSAKGNVNSPLAGTSTYFEFTLTPDFHKKVTVNSISFGSRSSTAGGPLSYALRSSLDNYTADLATGATLANNTWGLRSPATTSSSSNYGTSVTYRLYGYDGSGGIANVVNWRIDDVSLSLQLQSAPPCDGTPSAGTASAASGPFCLSGSTTISLAGNSDPDVETGIQFQWYSSTDNSTFNPIPSETNPTLATGTITQTTYYYCIVTCVNSGLTATSNTVTVTVNQAAIAGTVSGTSPLCIGQTANYISSGGDAGGVWSSTNTAAATVDAFGVVTAAGAGSSDITYMVSGCTGTVSNFQTIVVNPTANAGTVSGTSPLCAGSSTTYTVTGADAGGTWSSSLPGVASVDAFGNVTALAAGTTSISYTVNSGCFSPVSSSQSLTVNAIPATPGITVLDNGNGTSTLTATGFTGTLLWSTTETTTSIIVSTAGIYTVKQIVNGCESALASVSFSPSIIADPAVTGLDITDIFDVSIPNANLSPFNQVLKVKVPVFNLSQDNPVPAGAITLRIDLGSKFIVDPNISYILANAPLNNYFNWTQTIESGNVVIYGDQYATIPADFDGMASFQVIATVSCISEITAIIIVDNHSSTTTLQDEDIDNNAATLQYSVIVPAPDVTVTQPTCTTPTGTITVNSPTAPGMTYSIDGLDYSNTSGVFPGLTPGPYNVTARTSDLPVGCTSAITVAVVNPQPTTPTTITYTIDQPTCTTPTGTITITSPLGAGLSYSTDGVDYSNTSGVFPGLNPGPYSLTVKTTDGCVSTPTIATVDPQPSTPTTILFNVTQPNCGTATGTITITSPTAVGMTYSIDGLTYTNTDGIFPGLTAGPYNLTVKTAQGCISPITVATVNAQPATPNITVTNIAGTGCSGSTTGSITVSASGAPGGFTYTIISGPTINTTGQSSGVFTGLTAGNYTISVLAGSGCSNTVDALVPGPTGTVPDISLGSDLTSNFFAAMGTEQTIVYNVSEIAGNLAVGDTIRITRVPNYILTFDDLATGITSIGPYTLDNQNWKINTSNPSFISLIYDPNHNSTPGALSCGSRVYVSINFKRNTPNISIFFLSARLRKANNEVNLINNLNSLLFTAE